MRSGAGRALSVGTDIARSGAGLARTGAARAREAAEDVDPDEVARTILDAVHRAAETRWEPAQRRAEALAGATHEDRLADLRRQMRKELVPLGAATGAVAAVPGVGTVTASGVLLADLGWMAVRNADVIFTVAALHGRDDAEVEERTAWVLAVLVFGDDAAAKFGELASELTRKAVTTAGLTSMKAMNKALAKRIFKSWGKKKAAKMMGRLLPFGIGAVVGGTTSYLDVKALVAASDRFFDEIPRDHGAPSLLPWLDRGVDRDEVDRVEVAEVSVVTSDGLDDNARSEVRSLMDRAFDDYTDDDWHHGLGGHHVIVRRDGRIVAHASVVPRTLWVAGEPTAAGYVESVATDPDSRGEGLGALAMERIAGLISEHGSLGALATSSPGFYEGLGWERWRGPTSVRRATGEERTPEEDGGILALRLPSSPPLDLSAPIACEERPGDDW